MDEQLEIMTNDAFNDLDIKVKGLDTENLPPLYNQVKWLFNKATKGKYSMNLENATEAQKFANIQSAEKSAAKWGGWCTAGLGTLFYGGMALLAPEHYQSIGWAWDVLNMDAVATGAILIGLSDHFRDWKRDHQVYMSGAKHLGIAGFAVPAVDLAIKYFL